MVLSLVGILSLTLIGKPSTECVMKIKIGLLMLVKLTLVSLDLKMNGDKLTAQMPLCYIVIVHLNMVLTTVKDLGIVKI
jgi:hypothetical protein